MRLPHPFDPRARQGYALIITLVFLTITLLTLSSVMWWAASSGKVTRQNELFTTAEAAADAAAETVVATMDRDWTYGQALQSASVYAGLALPDQTSWPMKFQYSDGSGNNNRIGVTIGHHQYLRRRGFRICRSVGLYQYPAPSPPPPPPSTSFTRSRPPFKRC